MTNLSASLPTWKRRFSRERVLVGAPVLAAVVVLLGLVLVDGWPRLSRLHEQQKRLEELRLKQAASPGLLRQLARQEIRAQEVMQQQAVLLDLIAGRERIQTFLAQISREAAASGVAIELYEPESLPMSATESLNPSSRNRSNRAKPKAAPKDPLTELGYTKTSVLLQAKGPYEALQLFLRRMELLQLLVQPSDLALTALDAKVNAKDDAKAPVTVVTPMTQLKLRLSFFDRVALPEANAADPQPAF